MPVPVDVERANAILDKPLDLPVDHFGIRLVVPAEHGLAFGADLPNSLPGLNAGPTWKIECTDIVIGFDGLRLGHIGGLLQIQRRQHFYGNFDKVSRCAWSLHRETCLERHRLRTIQDNVESGGLAAVEILHQMRVLFKDFHASRQLFGNDLDGSGRLRAKVLEQNRQRRGRSHAIEGVGETGAFHDEIGRQNRLLLDEREVGRLGNAFGCLDAHEADCPLPGTTGLQMKEVAMDSTIARDAKRLLLDTTLAISCPQDLRQ